MLLMLVMNLIILFKKFQLSEKISSHGSQILKWDCRIAVTVPSAFHTNLMLFCT